MAKALNIKNMKERIINYSGDQKEFDRIWDSFYTMSCIGFIDHETWVKFFNECAGWYIDDEGENIYVRDSRNNDNIVWTYTGDAEYTANKGC